MGYEMKTLIHHYNSKKCAAFACPKQDTCARYAGPGPSRDPKDYDVFHPDKPWLCFKIKTEVKE